jgi:hypothetical protein
MKALCVHGIGRAEADLDGWWPDWQAAISEGVSRPASPPPGLDYLPYDDLFEGPLGNLSYADFAKAFWLLSNGVFRRSRGLFDFLEFSDTTRWYAGMVVVWINDESLRAALRDRFTEKFRAFDPDVVFAHSLGSLIAYDAFAHDPDLVANKVLVTFGSQIGNPAVRGSAFAGRVGPLAQAEHWYHLYNRDDHVFTAPLDSGAFRTATNFQQIATTFGSVFNGFADGHFAVNPGDPDHAYLTHPAARTSLWPRLAKPAVRAFAVPARAAREMAEQAAPSRRALLVGLNANRDPARRLEGCINDVFLMSSVLQECGFEAEDVRVVLDERATADGIRERLGWLLDGTKEGDVRFFYYSGHGSQLPAYGPQGKVDRIYPSLVPYDFDWTADKAITDADLEAYYSQLPYGSHFMMVFDCCYAGGLVRGGAWPRGRALDPPDDVRHRMLKWDTRSQMWVPREFSRLTGEFEGTKNTEQFTGKTGASLRLGRAVDLRAMPRKEYVKERRKLGHNGPFMPVVYEACGERELSTEYQHGAISYGAFTYSLAAVLRRGKPGEATFTSLLRDTARQLKDLGYDQHPEVSGPKEVLKQLVPWLGAG